LCNIFEMDKASLFSPNDTKNHGCFPNTIVAKNDRNQTTFQVFFNILFGRTWSVGMSFLN